MARARIVFAISQGKTGISALITSRFLHETPFFFQLRVRSTEQKSQVRLWMFFLLFRVVLWHFGSDLKKIFLLKISVISFLTEKENQDPPRRKIYYQHERV